MADFVLVHGAWHGAWCWRRVLEPLWRAGHRAFAVSLTGLGERAHQRHSPGLGLVTHIDDVLGVLEAEELHDAVLVGHSYAGMVITGVAHRAASRLRRLVYVDAIVPAPGETWSASQTPAIQAQRRALIAAQGVLPAPDPAVFGLQGADAQWVARRQTPQPGALYDDPLWFDAERVWAVPCAYIACTAPALASIDASRQRARERAGWQWFELATGHDAMISAPQALFDLLLHAAL